MASLNPQILRAGDCLLYAPKGFFGWLISIKTWHAIAHCEAYLGPNDGTGERESVASRDGQGVQIYPLRTSEIARVLRPTVPFDQDRALAWFNQSAKGQRYDWLGLLRFAWRAKVVPDAKDNKQFCSEFLTRYYRSGGLDPFNGEDADAIPPFMFTLSPFFAEVWSIEDVESPGEVVAEGRD